MNVNMFVNEETHRRMTCERFQLDPSIPVENSLMDGWMDGNKGRKEEQKTGWKETEAGLKKGRMEKEEKRTEKDPKLLSAMNDNVIKYDFHVSAGD